jgi:hypothetical protein
VHIGSRPRWWFHESLEYLAFLKETGIGCTPAFISQLRLVLDQALIPGSMARTLQAPMLGPGPSYDEVVKGCQRVIRSIVACGGHRCRCGASRAHMLASRRRRTGSSSTR